MRIQECWYQIMIKREELVFRLPVETQHKHENEIVSIFGKHTNGSYMILGDDDDPTNTGKMDSVCVMLTLLSALNITNNTMHYSVVAQDTNIVG